MPDSTLNRRSVALYVAKPTQLSYPQKTAECQKGHLQSRSNTIIPFDGFAHKSDLDNELRQISSHQRSWRSSPPGSLIGRSGDSSISAKILCLIS